MNSYFVFTDEAGAYQRKPNEKHIRSHPFYIRSNVLMSIEDYRQYQIDMQRISGEYKIPFDEEIKWSDLWSKTKGKPRNDMIIGIVTGSIFVLTVGILMTDAAAGDIMIV